MGFLDSIFGSGPEELSPARIEKKSIRTSEQEQLLQQLIGFFGSPGSFQGDNFQGAFNVGAGDVETLSLDALGKRAEALATGQLQGQAEGALGDILGRGATDIDDFFTKTVQEPLLEDFQRDILPGISRQFGSGDNFFGSERREADSRASEDLLDTLGRERSRTAFEARQSDAQLALQAAGLLPGVLGATSGAVSQNLGASAQANAPENQRLQAEYQDFIRKQGEKNQRTSQILATLGLQPVENIAFPSVVSQGQKGILGELIGAGGKIAAAKFGGGF